MAANAELDCGTGADRGGDLVSLDPQLLEILACPDTHHAALTYDESAQTLTCTECGRIFEIRDGLPVLLLEEARPPSGEVA
jgi:uncharacterized protein